VSQSLTYEQAIDDVRILELLAPFDPRIVGTLPIGIAVKASDIDIVCHAADAVHFSVTIWEHLKNACSFSLHQWVSTDSAVVARFVHAGWSFEIFGSSRPVEEQAGWRHFVIEKRLLDLDDGRLRKAVMALRVRGQKTEPAFATALGLRGCPYKALLGLEAETDATLRDRIESYVFQRG
jgi:hypothetical protein